jgi:hypothetical protein
VQKRMAAIFGRNDLLAFNAENEVFEVTLQIPVHKNQFNLNPTKE